MPVEALPQTNGFSPAVKKMEVSLKTKNGSALPTNGHSPDGLKSAPDYVSLVEKVKSRIASGDQFFSLEFFPPKTPNGVANFLQRLDRLREGSPLFCDVTWHMGSDPGSTTKETSSTSIAASCLNYGGLETMLHVTCAQYEKEETLKHLEQAKELGIRNILALRGDLPPGKSLSEYKYQSVDLVRWIREEYGDYFGIAVAGYPTGHPDAVSYDADLQNLKAKVEAGADMVVTQLFFEAEEFEKYVRDCRALGINVPIIPGIMPIQSYANIKRIAELSKLAIPQKVLDAMEPFKHDDDRVVNYGIWFCTEMCKRLLSSGVAPSLHMYTLNRESATRQILQNVGLWTPQPIRSLPWKPQTAHYKRCQEDVRPIFWSTRPKAYVYRTRDWDDYPNGRWGSSSSPAFGDVKDYYLFYLKGQKPAEELRGQWGESLDTEQTVWDVFSAFMAGANNSATGKKVARLPWNEHETLDAETGLISEQLASFNKRGILTINSQPAVNGAPASDPLVGWGSTGGYCYQKAYVEFFTRRETAQKLLSQLKTGAYSTRINYHVINHDGSFDETNADGGNTPIAVTWGVFPGREVAQPTIVDPVSFRVWKDEAFQTWLSTWAVIYPEESPSRQLLKQIHDEYCLVTLVDNDYVAPTILWDLLDKVIAP